MTALFMLACALVLMWGVYLLGSGGDRIVEAAFLHDRARALRGSRLVAWGVAVLLFVGLLSSSAGPRP